MLPWHGRKKVAIMVETQVSWHVEDCVSRRGQEGIRRVHGGIGICSTAKRQMSVVLGWVVWPLWW